MFFFKRDSKAKAEPAKASLARPSATKSSIAKPAATKLSQAAIIRAAARPLQHRQPAAIIPGLAPPAVESVEPVQRVRQPGQPARLDTTFVANDGFAGSADDFDFGSAGKRDWKKLRRPPSTTDRRVTDEAMQWMALLPRNLRLMHTMRDYPHVVNGLVAVWNKPEELSIHFENLINSSRQNRAGFPPLVRAELVALRAYSLLKLKAAAG